MQPEHEPEVVGQPGEERHLRRPGVREHRRQAAPAEDVERRVADGAHAPDLVGDLDDQAQLRPLLAPRSARCPRRVDEKPHCGERQSCSMSAILSPPPRSAASARPSTRARRASSSRGRARRAFALRQEAQRLEAARALVVPLHEEPVDLELVEERLGDEVVAALGRPTTSGSCRGTCASSPPSRRAGSASASLMWRMYSTCWRVGVAADRGDVRRAGAGRSCTRGSCRRAGGRCSRARRAGAPPRGRRRSGRPRTRRGRGRRSGRSSRLAAAVVDHARRGDRQLRDGSS